MELKHLNEQEFNTVKNGMKPAMIDFFATWCGPCKMLGPVMEQLADRYDGKAVVAKVDVDEQQMLAIQYGVMSVPTVLFLKNGEEVGRLVGVQPAETYAQTLDKLLKGIRIPKKQGGDDSSSLCFFA